MAKQPTYINLIRNNLRREPSALRFPKDVAGAKVLPLELNSLSDVLRLLIAYFCCHPRRIVEQIQRSGEKGIEEVVANLFAQTLRVSEDRENSTKGVRVWRGTIGEVLATAYVIGFTSYIVPIFKLRFAPNRRLAMHGDDLLGFQFTQTGEPRSLLVGEAKNWENNIGGAVRKANETLLNVKSSSPTLLNFVIEELDAQGRHDEAKMVERFLNKYDYEYKAEYLAFIVSDDRKWKDDFYLEVGPNPATPLEVAIFLIPNSEVFQKSLTLTEEEPLSPSIPVISVDDLADAQRLLDNSTFKDHHSKLASATLAADLQIEDRGKIIYDLDTKRIAQIEEAARLLSIVAIRLPPDKQEQRENLFRYAARIFERLAVWELERGEKSNAISAIVDGAVTYSLAGYDANARVLMQTVHEIESYSLLIAPGQRFSALFLSGRLAELEDELAELLFSVKQFDLREAKTEAEWAELVGQALAHVADLLVAKSFALLLHYLRTGKSELMETAIDSLQRSRRIYPLIGDYSSSHLSTILTVYFVRLTEDSPHALLSKYIGRGVNG